MNTSEFATLVTAVRSAHPTWFDLPSDQPVDGASLDRLEAELGVTLPSDYRWFLETYGGGDFAFVAIYSADDSSDLLVTRNQPDAQVPFVAVSDDGTGNLIGFPITDGHCEDRILVFDHEDGELRGSPYGGFLEFVATVGLRQASQ